MAISNLGAINTLPDAQLPAGYTKPVVATFADFDSVRSIKLLVPKATVETATASATLLAIFNNATVGINKQIVDIIAADYLSTATVVTYGELIGLTTSLELNNFTNTTYLTNAVVNYECVVRIYVKAT